MRVTSNFTASPALWWPAPGGIRCPGEPEQEIVPYVLLKELCPGFLNGVTGVYHTPQGYCVDEAAVEEFDQNFPPKEKLRLPGQLF